MAKAKLTTRAISTTTVTSDNLAKASQLTHNQLDSNFLNLRDATFGVVADDSATIQVGMDSNLEIKGGTNISTATDSAGVVTITGAGTATSLTTDGLTVADADIKGTRSNENIVIDPAGTGSVSIDKVSITGGTITGITDLVVADGGTGASSLTDNSVLTGTGASPITAEGNLTFSGSTLAVTGAATVSTTLGVTGASTLDGVTVTDNTISSNDSNANLEINANGTGTVNLENLKIGTSGSTVTTILDEDAMGTNSATALATQQSIKAYVDGQTHTGATLTGSTNNTLTTVTGANAFQGEANATFDGSTLAVTGNITATTNIENDAIRISDNVILGLRSNEDLSIQPAGTGNVVLGGIRINGTNISADDSSRMQLGETSVELAGIIIENGIIKPTASNANLELQPNGTGAIHANDSYLLTGTGSGAARFSSKGAQSLAMMTNDGDGTSYFTINHNGNFKFYGNTSIDLSESAIVTSSGSSDPNITLTPQGAGLCDLNGGGTTVQTYLTVDDNIDIRDNTIKTTVSNSNLELSANSSGIVHVNDSLKIGTGATVTTILDEDNMATDSATALATQQSIKKYIDDSAGAGFRIFGDDSAGVDIAEGGSLYLRGGDNVTTSTNSDGTLTITASGGGASTGDITFVGSTIISPSNADLTLNPAGTGKVNINAVYTLPNADGSANEVLGTNGSGVLSFRDPTAINIDGGVVDSTYTSVPTIDGGTA